MLPVSVPARGRDQSSTSPAAVSWSSRTSRSTRSSFEGHFPGAPLMPAVADARIAVAGGRDSAAAARSMRRRTRASICAASTTRSSAGRWCPAIGCGSKSRSAERARSLARAQAMRLSGDQVGRRGRAAARPRPRSRPTSIRPPSCIRRAQIGDGHDHRPARHRSAPTCSIGANCRIGASAVIDGWTEIGDDTEIYPFASIGLIPQDLKFRGEKTRLVIGTPQHLPGVRHDPPRHARRRRRDDDRRPQRVHGLRARRARLPRRQRHDLRPPCDARRPRHGRGLRQHQRRLGVHQFCRVGQHAFIGGYSVVTEGRAAVRTHRGQPRRRGFSALNTIGLMRRGFSPRSSRS